MFLENGFRKFSTKTAFFKTDHYVSHPTRSCPGKSSPGFVKNRPGLTVGEGGFFFSANGFLRPRPFPTERCYETVRNDCTHELALDVAVFLQHPVRDARDVAFDGHPVRFGVASQRRFVLHEAHHDRIERVQDGTLARHGVLAPRTVDGHDENAV